MDEKLNDQEADLEENHVIPDDLMDVQLSSALESEKKLEETIENIKTFKEKLNKDFIASCSEQELKQHSNMERLQSYQEEIENDLKSLLNSDNLNEYFLNVHVDNSELAAVFEQRLILETKETTKNLKNKKPSQSNSCNDIASKIAELENKYNFLKQIYEKRQLDMSGECEKLINEIQECFVVYSK